LDHEDRENTALINDELALSGTDALDVLEERGDEVP